MNTPNFTPAPPQLKTLHTKPTWHNRAGRVDRSACFVISAAKLWRQLHDDDWTYRTKQPPKPAGDARMDTHINIDQPNHRASVAPRLKGFCDRYATRTLYARDLWLMHKWESPYPLQGDFRTAKTNALRHTPRPIDQRGDRPRAQHMRKDNILGQGPTNPNRGVGFNTHKMLGLDCMWSTTLRVERYIQHAKLKQHFLVCPVCGNNKQNKLAGGRRPHGCSHQHLPTKPPGERRSPAIVTKLYLPLCTPQENNDAQLAQLWLQTHCHPNRPWPPAAVQLIERYGELFAPRNLRCRQCLGLRYGEVKGGMGVSPVKKSHANFGHFLQPPGHARADHRAANPANPSSARVVTRRLTEQSLFLQNLPKLLAPVPDDLPPLPRHPSKPHPVANQQSEETLPTPVREELLRLLFQQTPSFKAMQQAKQHTP